MAEELQFLIDQIQKEGIDKATKEAREIIENAKKEALEIISKAEEEYQEKSNKAEKEAQAFEEKSIQSIKQASRDIIISLGQSCEKIISKILTNETNSQINSEILKTLISKVVSDSNKDTIIKINSKDFESLQSYITNLSKEKNININLEESNEILSGFTISFNDNKVYLDYSGDAISSAICSFIRPELAKIISEVNNESTAK